MTMVQQECIYNLVSQPKEKDTQKSTYYKSKYDPKAPLTGSTFGLHGTTVTVGKGINELKKTCVISSTFGPPNRSASDPKNFLRKGSMRCLPKSNNNNNGKEGYSDGSLNEINESSSSSCPKKTRKSFQRPNPAQKAAVPKRHDRPIMGLKTTKSFVNANAIDAILSVPKTTNTNDIRYTEKENYGKVPEYLNKVKEEIERENEIVDEYVRRRNQQSNGYCPEFDETNCDVLDEEERLSLIRDLKKRWDVVNAKYQKICHRVTIETTGDIKRKEAQEKELVQLEQDIEQLSRPGPILIHN